MAGFDFADVLGFAGGAGLEDRVAGAGEQEALVDHPGVGFDAGAAEIRLQSRGFVDGGGLGEGYQEDSGEIGVSEAGEEVANSVWHFARRARHFTVVGFGGIE